MKKRNLNSLRLNKKSISSLVFPAITGQGPNTVNLTCASDFTYEVHCINFTEFAGCFHSLDTVCEVTDQNATCSPNSNFVCMYSELECGNADTLN
ncbi:hypothetical protein [Kordia jejudonensis]|uniref:hypothetical protein n=1 Tax=Kordia jejudonensis TaxID=1348245 RepID=UPI0006294CE7|nr:hypothetical protein [Kordia jejudonensis]